MIDAITKMAESDSHLSGLYAQAKDYVQIYSFIKERQRGCDGLGEVNNLKDELMAVLDEMVVYCKKKGIFPAGFSYDKDMAIEEFHKASVYHS
ncbi:MAG TPA: hypothetical protein DHV16_06435 [Nitrospiraceae bacterium]|nr:MAG: hypothetical protein A2Z82_02890 [Nitrospirae bacterium GWA2_46_11]HCZ11881.1 hypothetical protein [Nitrospiraceae bacterium]